MTCRTTQRGHANREYILELLRNSCCKDCQTKDIEVLEFDHIRDKKYTIATIMKKGYGLDTLKEEIAKCEIVCANCHRKRSYKRQGNVYKCQPKP